MGIPFRIQISYSGVTSILLDIDQNADYAILSEWLNVKIWRSWAYTSAMPLLPGTGTGLTPLLQWLIVPALAFAIILAHGEHHHSDTGSDRTERKP
jgi:hypothetical protein